MAKSKFFRVFVEGFTASDGRQIMADWINEIVGNFNAATYPVNINCEHLKGFSPEPPFNCYGAVTAVKAEDVDIVIDGKPEKRRALYAQIDPNDQLLTILKAGQKRYTSVEITPDFAKTGKFGLVGLAVTDTPASLGTEALNFSALKPKWDSLKADPANLFTPSTAESELSIDMFDDADVQSGLLAKITGAIDAAFAKFTAKPEEKPAPAAELPKPANDNDMAAFAQATGAAMAAAIGAYAATNDQALAKVSGDLAALTAKLAGEDAGTFSRPLATGGGATAETDC
jgi:hypothetical protein